MDHLCYLCLVFVMLSRLFIAALWLPEGKGLTSWLLLVMFIVILLLSHFPGQVWCLIASIPDHCCRSYFKNKELMCILHLINTYPSYHMHNTCIVYICLLFYYEYGGEWRYTWLLP